MPQKTIFLNLKTVKHGKKGHFCSAITKKYKLMFSVLVDGVLCNVSSNNHCSTRVAYRGEIGSIFSTTDQNSQNYQKELN